MAPRKPDNECYVQGTNMKLSEAVARANGTYKPSGMEKSKEAAKKLPTATQTKLSAFARMTSNGLSFVARKAHGLLQEKPEEVDEPLVVLPKDSRDEYYWDEDTEGLETGEEHDCSVVKGPTMSDAKAAVSSKE